MTAAPRAETCWTQVLATATMVATSEALKALRTASAPPPPTSSPKAARTRLDATLRVALATRDLVLLEPSAAESKRRPSLDAGGVTPVWPLKGPAW
jgi:hypothetical protein